MRRMCALAILIAGCGDDTTNTTVKDASTVMIDAPKVVDAPGPDAPITAFVMPGVSYGAYWDATAQELLVTDDTNMKILTWTRASGFQTFATVPGGSILGNITKLPDGTYLVPTKGNNTSGGGIYSVSADGATVTPLTGLNAARQRIGLAADSNGLVYEAFFNGTGTMTPAGGVASVAIAAGAGTETSITTSMALKRVTGLIMTSTTTMVVCDQTVPKLFSVDVATGTTAVYASPPSCDQIIALPNGDLLTGGLSGGVYRITPTGTITSVVSGMDQIRGLAYDPTGKNLYVVEHRTTAVSMPVLHVFHLE